MDTVYLIVFAWAFGFAAGWLLAQEPEPPPEPPAPPPPRREEPQDLDGYDGWIPPEDRPRIPREGSYP